MMKVRDGIGMLFQESALFDSLTVADNVGYKLYEETDMPAGQVAAASKRCWGSSGWRSTSTGCPRSCQAGSGAASRSRAPWPHGRNSCCSTSQPRDSTRSRRRPWTPKSSSCRDVEHVTSIVVTHQLPGRLLRRHASARRQNGRLAIVPADEVECDEVEFIMLRDGRIYFEGKRRGAARIIRSLFEGVPIRVGSTSG